MFVFFSRGISNMHTKSLQAEQEIPEVVTAGLDNTGSCTREGPFGTNKSEFHNI